MIEVFFISDLNIAAQVRLYHVNTRFNPNLAKPTRYNS